MFTGIRFTSRSFLSSDLYIKSKFSVSQHLRKKSEKLSSTKLVPGAKKVEACCFIFQNGYCIPIKFRAFFTYNKQFSSVQSLSRVRLCDPMKRSTPGLLSITNSRSSLRLTSVESVMPSRFNPWVGKIPWNRKWQPTPVFLLGNSMGREAWWAAVHGVTESDVAEATQHVLMHSD